LHRLGSFLQAKASHWADLIKRTRRRSASP
jgi:hypothetical protein